MGITGVFMISGDVPGAIGRSLASGWRRRRISRKGTSLGIMGLMAHVV